MGKKGAKANPPAQTRTLIAKEFKRYGVEQVFTRLLTTWPLRETRRPKNAPRPPPNELILHWRKSQGEAAAQESLRGWFLKGHEKSYGDGHYADRAKLLRVALRFLEDRAGVDLAAVFGVLCMARSDAARTNVALLIRRAVRPPVAGSNPGWWSLSAFAMATADSLRFSLCLACQPTFVGRSRLRSAKAEALGHDLRLLSCFKGARSPAISASFFAVLQRLS